MSIKPIDLQVNINQMHEIGRGEQARTGAIAEQQHVLDEESSKSSKMKNSRLDESKKAERTEIRDALADDKEKEEEAAKKKRQGEEEASGEKPRQLSHDDRLGKNIDFLK